MICSGEQVIAFYYLDKADIATVEEIVNDHDSYIRYDEKGISNAADCGSEDNEFIAGDSEWRYVKSNARNQKLTYSVQGM